MVIDPAGMEAEGNGSVAAQRASQPHEGETPEPEQGRPEIPVTRTTQTRSSRIQRRTSARRNRPRRSRIHNHNQVNPPSDGA